MLIILGIYLISCRELKRTAEGVQFFRNFYWDLGFYDIRYPLLEER
jgi:hypothetical protein